MLPVKGTFRLGSDRMVSCPRGPEYFLTKAAFILMWFGLQSKHKVIFRPLSRNQLCHFISVSSSR